jgi:hypothetical protein
MSSRNPVLPSQVVVPSVDELNRRHAAKTAEQERRAREHREYKKQYMRDFRQGKRRRP